MVCPRLIITFCSMDRDLGRTWVDKCYAGAVVLDFPFAFSFPCFNGSVLALEMLSSFVRILTPSKYLDEHYSADAISVGTSRLLGLPTEFFA